MGGTALSPLKPFGINEAIQETFMSDPIAFEELNRKFFEDHERREELGCKLLGIDGPGDFTRKANPEDCIDLARKYIWENRLKEKRGFKMLREAWEKHPNDDFKQVTIEFQFILFSGQFKDQFPDLFDEATIREAKRILDAWGSDPSNV